MASFTLKFDGEKIRRALENGADDLPMVIEQALGDVMDKWKAQAVNIALLDKSTLRRGISVETIAGDDAYTGLIKSVAMERGFNYAYYWHEIRGHVDNPTTPGTVAKYLDVSAAKNKANWQKYFEREIEVYISKIGR